MASRYICRNCLGNDRGKNNSNVVRFLHVKSPALTGLSGAESALTRSGEYGGNPTATLFFDRRSVVVLPTKCNLYGFTGMQDGLNYGYGNLPQMWEDVRNHLSLLRVC